MLKHFIYSSSDKSTTSLLCSFYYKYSSKPSSFFCILSFLVRATSIDQTFYSATHYLAAVWLDSRHGFNRSIAAESVSIACYELQDARRESLLSQNQAASEEEKDTNAMLNTEEENMNALLFVYEMIKISINEELNA